MALCLCRLGLRAKEVTSLKLEDVDWEAQTLHLQQTKTRRSRLVPLPADVAAAIRDYLQAGRPPTKASVVFVRHRAPYCGANRRSGFLRAAMRGACIRAGLGHQGVHILRHYADLRTMPTGVSKTEETCRKAGVFSPRTRHSFRVTVGEESCALSTRHLLSPKTNPRVQPLLEAPVGVVGPELDAGGIKHLSARRLNLRSTRLCRSALAKTRWIAQRMLKK
jgi:integrase